MKPIIIGSYALHVQGIDLPRSDNHVGDIDVICTKDDAKGIITKIMGSEPKLKFRGIVPTKSGFAAVFRRDGTSKIIEFDTSVSESNGLLMALDEPHAKIFDLPDFGEIKVASPDVVYMLKMSHRFKKNSKHFLKTMQDIQFMRKSGIEFPDDLKQFYDIRVKETYDYGHPKLNVSKESFFTDSVPYKYDHDSIHRAVAVDDVPAYTRYMIDGAQVLTSREKFDKLPRIQRLNGVLEESYVLALERSIIPHGNEPKAAFDMALSKVCTSITSGWFRDFAWENYEAVQALYNGDFVEKFESALAQGLILPYNNSNY